MKRRKYFCSESEEILFLFFSSQKQKKTCSPFGKKIFPCFPLLLSLSLLCVESRRQPGHDHSASPHGAHGAQILEDDERCKECETTPKESKKKIDERETGKDGRVAQVLIQKTVKTSGVV